MRRNLNTDPLPQSESVIEFRYSDVAQSPAEVVAYVEKRRAVDFVPCPTPAFGCRSIMRRLTCER